MNPRPSVSKYIATEDVYPLNSPHDNKVVPVGTVVVITAIDHVFRNDDLTYYRHPVVIGSYASAEGEHTAVVFDLNVFKFVFTKC